MKLYKLFTPGPVDVPEDVLKETAKPLIYHREDKFKTFLLDLTTALRKVMFTNNQIYFLTSSGTGAMETALVNVLSSTDTPIVASSGKFGERWIELCRNYRVNPMIVGAEYGRTVPPEAIEDKLKKLGAPTVVLTTLTETSTGVINDIKAYGDICRRHDSLLVVDGIAGLGADYCPQDEWNIDILLGASQKAFMSPPGIAFISVSARAHDKIKRSDLPKYYFHLDAYEKFLEKGQTPWTPAITILFGLHKGLNKILKEGVKTMFKRHAKIGDYARKRVRKMGLEIFPERPSNALTVMKMPPDINSTDIIKEIKEKYFLLFANGQGEMRGKILRIGHMGNYTVTKVGAAINILERVYKKWS